MIISPVIKYVEPSASIWQLLFLQMESKLRQSQLTLLYFDSAPLAAVVQSFAEDSAAELSAKAKKRQRSFDMNTGQNAALWL